MSYRLPKAMTEMLPRYPYQNIQVPRELCNFRLRGVLFKLTEMVLDALNIMECMWCTDTFEIEV